MTRHEAVEEEEKTHTELVSAGRQGGGQHEAAFAHGAGGGGRGTCAVPAGGSGMEQRGHVVGAEQEGRGSTRKSQPDGRTDGRTSGADAMRVSQRDKGWPGREGAMLPGPCLLLC